MDKFTGIQYLQMDIAANHSMDGAVWSDRLAWFENHKENLLDHVTTAKNPALYFAGVKAWEQVQQGKPTGYPISLDATCSGLQILAALTCDRGSAILSNLIDTGSRRDAYTEVYRAMVDYLGETAQIIRDDTKQAILTSLYGSTFIPKTVFGEGKLLNTFHSTMEELCPLAWKLNSLYLSIWDADRLKYSWVLPDNFHVHSKVMANVMNTVHFKNTPYDIVTKENMPIPEGRSLAANTTHSVDGMVVREMLRRCNYSPETIICCLNAINGDALKVTVDMGNVEMVETLWGHYKRTGFLSARILDHIDYHTVDLIDVEPVMELIDTLPEKPFEVLAIHDCFRVLPNYGNDLRMQYNRILHDIAKSSLLDSLLSQIIGKVITVTKEDKALADEILEANYSIC